MEEKLVSAGLWILSMLCDKSPSLRQGHQNPALKGPGPGGFSGVRIKCLANNKLQRLGY